MRNITIGKPDSKICATCEFWEGPKTLAKSRGHVNHPEDFSYDSQHSMRATCIKRKRMCYGHDKCIQHQFRYDLMKYL